MATPQEKAFRMIFPEAANQPQQQAQQPFWASGNTISGRGARPTGRRRNVFYDAQTGAPTSNPGQPIGGANNDLEIIREIMRPQSSIVTNDPSGWLNGGASREFQEFFKKTPEQDAAYARRKRELDAGSMANVDPRISRNAVEVAKQNQEAMNMIFPKQPAGDPMATRSDMVKTALPGGGFTASLDGRYGKGSSTVRPRPMISAQTEIGGKKLAEPILFNNAPKVPSAPSATANDPFNANALFDVNVPQYGANVSPMRPNNMSNPFVQNSPAVDTFQGDWPNQDYMSSLSPAERVNYETEFYKRKQSKQAPLQSIGDAMSYFVNPNRGQSNTSSFSFPAF